MVMVEYIKNLRRQKRRYQYAILLSPWAGALIAIILLRIVRSGSSIGIPDAASQYMLQTLFYEFSHSELDRILIAEIGSSAILPILLIIYWGYLCTAVLISIVPFIAFMLYMRFRRQRYKRGLLDSDALLNAISGYLKKPSLLSRLKLIWTARASAFHQYTCPIRPKWYRSPEFQWFSTKDIDKGAWSIVAALTEFKEALVNAVDQNLDLREFIKPIQTFQEFHLSVACRSDESLRFEDIGCDKLSERAILDVFSREVRPLIIASARSSRQQAEPSRLLLWLSSLGIPCSQSC